MRRQQIAGLDLFSVLRIPIRGYEVLIKDILTLDGKVTNPYKGLWETFTRPHIHKSGVLRIPIRGYEPNAEPATRATAAVTNPYKGLWESTGRYE